MSKGEKTEIRFVQLVMLLFALTLTSFWMLGNLYARYAVQASGADQARVAGFQINMEKDGNPTTTTGIGINQEPGDLTADKIGFTVSGKSEVAFDYKVQVELTHADGTALTRDEWAKITPQITPSGETAVAGTPEMLTGGKSESCIYTFAKKETVSPGKEYSKAYTLDFTRTTLEKFAEGFRINVYIDGQQID